MPEPLTLQDKTTELLDDYARSVAWQHKQAIDKNTAIRHAIHAARENESRLLAVESAARDAKVRESPNGTVVIGDGKGKITLRPRDACRLASELNAVAHEVTDE